jgi:mannose-6-phosphate isomerase-like protein (cupin superfamily)
MLSNVERVFSGSDLLAMIIRCEFCEKGVHFFTDNAASQQLAFMRHPAGKLIEPHVHNPVPRDVQFTQEVLFIRKGRLRVDFYDKDQHYLESSILRSGDAILLIQGGHGFEILEEIEMFEVKQGPYIAERDKTRFVGIEQSEIKILK